MDLKYDLFKEENGGPKRNCIPAFGEGVRNFWHFLPTAKTKRADIISSLKKSHRTWKQECSKANLAWKLYSKYLKVKHTNDLRFIRENEMGMYSPTERHWIHKTFRTFETQVCKSNVNDDESDDGTF